MIHNVGSYSSGVTGTEHNLDNCVHKHSGKTIDADMQMKASASTPVQTQQKDIPSMLSYLTNSLRKVWGTGIGFLRGIWGESEVKGNSPERSALAMRDDITQSNVVNGTLQGTDVPVETMAAVADVKVQKQTEQTDSSEQWKNMSVQPTLKIRTGLARERFESGAQAFLKRMKDMLGKRKNHTFGERQERPGQQEKQMEWLETDNLHLLDSYNKNGEYTNLGNRIEGQGYGGNPMKDNYSKKI